MANNVGQLLAGHASALDAATASMVRSAIEANNYAQDLAVERTTKVLNIPPRKFDTYMMYSVPGDNGEPALRIVRFNMLVPTFIFIRNEAFVITKYTIKSTFEAAIEKKTGVESETKIGAEGKPGFLGIPAVGFSLSEKLNVNHDESEKQSNSMDVDIEMGFQQEALGYTEIVKAFTRAVNTIVDMVLNAATDNPVPLTDEEAKKLNEDAEIPIVDFMGSADGKDDVNKDESQQQAA